MQIKFKSFFVLFVVIFFALIGSKWMSNYSLWDDEANTALFAQSVHQTGDTSAILEHNMIAFRNGAELNENKKNRYVSPLQYYFLAPFLDPTHSSPIRARMPFFILTLISLMIIFRRLIKLKLPLSIFIAFFCLCFGLTSFLLFGIQSRYYALTFFFTLLLSEQYFFTEMKSSKQWIQFGLVSSLLFISNYLIGVAVLSSLMIHFVFIKKERIKTTISALIPHLFISVPIFLIWNPLGKKVVEMKNSPQDKLNLLFRNVRDFNGGHLGSLLLLTLGIFLFSKTSQKRFKTYALLFMSYLCIIALFSPQPVHGTGQADIRYLYPLMLLSFAWTLDFFNLLLQRNKFIFACGVFVFSFLALPYSGQWRMHSLELLQELDQPADDPYQLTSNELNQIKINADLHPSLLTSIDYTTYPLMFASPQFQYIQSEPHSAPDYLVDFCSETLKVGLENKFAVQYQKIATIQSTCREAFRPEVFLRSFGRNQVRGTISIYKKI